MSRTRTRVPDEPTKVVPREHQGTKAPRHQGTKAHEPHEGHEGHDGHDDTSPARSSWQDPHESAKGTRASPARAHEVKPARGRAG